MSANSFFGNKKRNSSILYDVDQTKITASFSSLQRSTSHSNVGNHGDGFPPYKRYKSVSKESKEMEDPFGDNDDFTADDLREIDIIASQALIPDVSSEANVLKTELSALPNSTSQFKTHEQWNVAHTTEAKLVDQFGSSMEKTKLKGGFRLETLEAQCNEAQKKLKEMQDEILIKNGEIRILRDSMQQMESTIEEQRKSYTLLEREKAQCLSEKEKEFSRKLQSLKSELQFRDAEMNELRTKILNCERIKPVASSVSCISPKKNLPNTVKAERCTQTEKKAYPTEESFGAEILPKPSCPKSQFHVQAPQVNNDSKISGRETEPANQETIFRCAQKQGSLLLNALMKLPIVPGSSLGIFNLLSNTETCGGPAMQFASFNAGSTETFSYKAASFQEGGTSLRTAQKLALTGLNLIAVDEGYLEETLEENRREFSHLKCCKIPGAVHLFPLLELHIGAYNQALLSMMRTRSISSGNQSACSSRTSSSTSSGGEDALSTLKEYALTSLGILYYIVFYSWEVVCTLLSHYMKKDCDSGVVDGMEKNDIVCSEKDRTNLQETIPDLDVASTDKSQHPLFKKLLELFTLSITAARYPGCHIVNQCLRILVKLAEKSTVDLLISFQCLFSSQSQVLLRCISSEIPLSAVHHTVSMLTLLAAHPKLADQFCSRSETCLLLALYMYITSRPDKLANELLWLKLEQETVRFLTKCVQCCRPPILLVGMDCQCNSEIVKALIIMLHRQWLTVRKVEGIMFNSHEKQVVQFLRDTVLLLHNLSQKDKLFHEHCLEVLHQYDRALPGVRAVLEKVQNLKACEELALDELYPSEPEVNDQEMNCR